MKILFYTDTPNYGGAEKQMELLAKYLPEFDFQVDLALGQYSKFAKLAQFDSGFSNLKLLNTVHKHDPRHYFELKRLLKREKYDLVHLHLWNPASCRYAFLAAKHVKVPIVVTEHDPFKLSGAKAFLKSKYYRVAQKIITISSDNQRLIQSEFPVLKERVNLIFNGIEIQDFVGITPPKDWPISKEKVVITCIAELHTRKGHRYLLRAFQELLAEFSNLELVLVGTGPMEKELKEQWGQHSNIRFLGWRNDIPAILSQSDFLVLPSPHEAFGLVLIEAMASNTIPIAVNSGGPKDIVKHEKSGFLVKSKNSSSIQGILKKCLNGHYDLEQIKKAGLKEVQEKFNAKKMSFYTAKVYESILNLTD